MRRSLWLLKRLWNLIRSPCTPSSNNTSPCPDIKLVVKLCGGVDLQPQWHTGGLLARTFDTVVELGHLGVFQLSCWWQQAGYFPCLVVFQVYFQSWMPGA